jgi:uncharacterized protein YkuJ
MKKNLILAVAGLISLMAINTAAWAQTKNISKNEGMKILPAHDSATPALSYRVAGKLELINTRVARNFEKNFMPVTNVTWYEMSDGYRATFELNKIQTWVNYDRKDNWLHTIRIYGEKELTAEVRHQVKSAYYDHVIKFVHEIEQPGNIITYIVHLEGEKTLIDLKLCNDEMKVLKEFVKSR